MIASRKFSSVFCSHEYHDILLNSQIFIRIFCSFLKYKEPQMSNLRFFVYLSFPFA
uniref:Uncharacterized protein n=1 Tax=Siphoviridae sp. ctQLz13 TaxID=2825492 RepID=A0A8S5NVK8_9CAUD|nr:MAG TPA: hypothetical protein [Siphoviridae sp. ctQLz13]